MEPQIRQTSATDNGQENSEAALNALVTEIKSNVNLEGALHPALAKLEQYDKENQSDFLRTLSVYLNNDCNAQKCGRLLFLHRNSLVYRIHRIEDITGCDLSDPTERAFLRLSLLLH